MQRTSANTFSLFKIWNCCHHVYSFMLSCKSECILSSDNLKESAESLPLTCIS